MSALMPETNRKNCVDPTASPMRRQNTSNQTHANASTRAAQLTANIPILITKSSTICSCGNFLARQDIYAKSGETGPLIVHSRYECNFYNLVIFRNFIRRNLRLFPSNFSGKTPISYLRKTVKQARLVCAKNTISLKF